MFGQADRQSVLTRAAAAWLPEARAYMSPRRTVLSTRLVSRLSTDLARKMVVMKFAVCLLLGTSVAAAQATAVRSGPGLAEMEKMCSGCHELARSVAPRQDRDGWIQTMTKMSAY